MKKSKFLKTLTIFGTALAAPMLLTGCFGGGSDAIRINDGYIQTSEDGRNWENLISIEELKNLQNGTGAGSEYTIGDDGYWYLNGVKTDKKAEGIDGNGIKSITKDTVNSTEQKTIYIIELDDGTKHPFEVINGINGDNGGNTNTWTIGNDGYWYLNGGKTDKKAVGSDGEPGKDADIWTIGADGYWYKNGAKTETKAEGLDGEPGKDADIWTIGADGYWYKNGVKTETKAEGADGEDGVSYYVHIKYADNQPTRNSDMKTTASNWIGIYNGTSETAPSNYTSYTWYCIKGADGEDGADGENGKDATYATYTITYEYFAAIDYFDNVIESKTIKSTEWLTGLPTIKPEYSECFLGWYIIGTDKQIGEYDFIGGNVTLVPKFDISKNAPAGLYQQGSLYETWSDIVTAYPNAFDGNEIISNDSNKSYFDRSGDLCIDSSITSIGDYAFYNCTSLKSVKIPNSVTSIGKSAFEGCSGLTSITIPEGVTSIGKSAFEGCSGLTSITIPEGVTTIEAFVFSSCKGLTSIDVPNSVTTIGDHAFSVCSGLTSIDVPNSVTTIGDHAFSGCSGLTSITIPEGVTTIEASVFYNCKGLTSVNIPEGVKTIGNGAFSYCTSLTSITIPEGVTRIGSTAFNAFLGCSNLISIVVEEGNTVYDSRDNCNAIIHTSTNELIAGCKTTIIPSSVKSIDNYAFAVCTGLTSITIPKNVTWITGNAFRGCSNLTSIVVEEGNTVYDSRDNCNAIIETSTNELIAGCKTTIIPSSVTSIGDDAFEGCTGLTSITIPNSVTTIGDGAFYNCSSLTSITIPNSVTTIGNDVFANCRNLKTVILDSATIANSLCSRYDHGDLIANVPSIYIKNGLDVSNSTYLASDYTKQTTSDKTGYDLYIRN